MSTHRLGLSFFVGITAFILTNTAQAGIVHGAGVSISGGQVSMAAMTWSTSPADDASWAPSIRAGLIAGGGPAYWQWGTPNPVTVNLPLSSQAVAGVAGICNPGLYQLYGAHEYWSFAQSSWVRFATSHVVLYSDECEDADKAV